MNTEFKAMFDTGRKPDLFTNTNPLIEIKIKNIDRAMCKEPSCQKTIYWWTNPETLKRTPISKQENGIFISHYKDCKKPNKF